jgi:hypothetical protein
MRLLLSLGFAAGTLIAFGSAVQLAPTAAQAQPAGPPISFTEQQARQGRGVFGGCESCHGGDLLGLDGGPPLVGEGFARRFNESPEVLFTFIKENMPADLPGSLTPANTAAVMAYILQSNGFTAGADALSSDPAVLATQSYPPHTQVP